MMDRSRYIRPPDCFTASSARTGSKPISLRTSMSEEVVMVCTCCRIAEYLTSIEISLCYDIDNPSNDPE